MHFDETLGTVPSPPSACLAGNGSCKILPPTAVRAGLVARFLMESSAVVPFRFYTFEIAQTSYGHAFDHPEFSGIEREADLTRRFHSWLEIYFPGAFEQGRVMRIAFTDRFRRARPEEKESGPPQEVLPVKAVNKGGASHSHAEWAAYYPVFEGICWV